MKALILAAGSGTRLRPYTNDRPKCMVEVAGKPLIEHTLSTLRSCGVTDISLVGGYFHEKLPHEGLKIYLNPRYQDTNMVVSLFCAEEAFTDDLIICYGDILFKNEVIQKLIQSSAPVSVIVDKDWEKQWKLRMENPLDDAETMKLDDQNNIVELGRKAADISEIQGQYIGLIKISAVALKEVRAFYHSLDKEKLYFERPFEKMHMTDFIQLIIDRLMPVRAVLIHGGWFEIDTVQDLHTYVENRFVIIGN